MKVRKVKGYSADYPKKKRPVFSTLKRLFRIRKPDVVGKYTVDEPALQGDVCCEVPKKEDE